MTTEEMVLAAVPGPRPAWSRTEGSISSLVETARGELALRAAARVLDEHAARLGVTVLEVARVRTTSGDYEGVYARCGVEPTPAQVESVQGLTSAVDQLTSELTAAMTGVKP